jgi:hypothetical protein
MPGFPLRSAQSGDRYLFRLVDAQRTHVLDSWQDAREELERDARRLAAYTLLKTDTHTWKNRVINETLPGLADALGEPMLRPAAFPRRQRRGQGWVFRLDTPIVQGVGKSQPFVDAAFRLAEGVLKAGGIDQASLEQRVAAIPVDRVQKLVLVRLDGIELLTESEFNRQKTSMDAAVGQSLLAQQTVDPFTTESIGKRLGFVASGPTAEDDADESPDGPAPHGDIDGSSPTDDDI